MPRRAVSASDSTARFIRRDRFALAFRKASTAGAGKNLLSTLNPSRGGDFFPLGGIGLAEIAEPAFLEGAVREFQRDLRRPAGLRLGYIFHDAHGVGQASRFLTETVQRLFTITGSTDAQRDQSAGASPEPWLGPAIEDVIPELAAKGHTNVLVAPLGFVCDHVEILYDLDIEAKKIADDHDVRLERTEMMNVTPEFIEAVADAILS